MSSGRAMRSRSWSAVCGGRAARSSPSASCVKPSCACRSATPTSCW